MHFTFKQSQSATEMNLLYLSLILTVWVGEQKKSQIGQLCPCNSFETSFIEDSWSTCTTNQSTLEALILHTYIQLHT